jgi:prepilin-type N-terminal cleavage/methylation domain-containing protein
MASGLRPPMGRGGHGGFTLIEILVTLVILSVGIVLVLEGFQTSIFALGASRDAMRADALLAQLMAQTELTLLAGGNAPGVADQGQDSSSSNYRWSVDHRVQPIKIGGMLESSNELHEITITVRHLTSGAMHSAATYIVARAP